MLNVGGGLFVYGSDCVFVLMVVVGFLFIVVTEVFCLMLVVGFFVYCDGWVFCLWQWLSFCVNGGGCVFCLMVVVVVGFLFMVVAGFLC